MKVKELMTANPKACTLTNSLADAAGLMWASDCGIVPVVSEGGKVVGLVTDRDICMAAALKGRQLGNIAVEDTISGPVFSCKPGDDVRTALKTMQENKVRRLPVVATDGTLKGVLSINDVVLKAEEAKGKKLPELSYGDVVKTLKSICQHRLPAEQTQAAARG
jgi:CBS domain-containing protein